MFGADDLQNQNFQQSLADGLGTVLGVADLLEHLAEKIENTGIIIKITDNLPGGLVGSKKGNPVDPENIVLKWLVGQGAFGVFRIRRNDDQVSRID